MNNETITEANESIETVAQNCELTEKPKNDTFSETFSKKLPALIPQVFSVESKPLFQKFFLCYCYLDICSPKRHTNLEEA